MKTRFFILLLLSFVFFQINAQNESKFPDSWDTNNDLRGSNGEVLAWTHKKDTTRPFEYKSCITLVVGKDSLGMDEYFISQMYTNEKPFNKWHQSSIHYGPDSTQLFGFHDVHIERFDHKPTEQEIYKLLDRWMFKLEKNDWITIEHGIDDSLWLKYFGFKPNKKLRME